MLDRTRVASVMENVSVAFVGALLIGFGQGISQFLLRAYTTIGALPDLLCWTWLEQLVV